MRSSPVALFFIALTVNLGMWLERYVIVVTSLSRDFLPSSWGRYSGTVWDWATFVGTIGLFVALLFLFVRFLPMISIFEMRTLLVPEAELSQGAAASVNPVAAPLAAPPADNEAVPPGEEHR